MAVVGTLYGMIQVGMKAGPCFNPAVAIAFMILEEGWTSNPNKIYTHYVFAYTVGPAVGGILAGIFSILHRKIHDQFDDGLRKTEGTRDTGVNNYD